MKGTCIRCGKPFRSVDDIHTCSLPKALALADELERHLGEFETATRAADELRRLSAENDKLKAALRRVIRTYMVADEAWDHDAEVERIYQQEVLK
jgi:hypothetical protein